MLSHSLKDTHRNTVRWEFWELHLQLQVTRWFSTLGAVALFEETSKRVKWFFNLDHSLGPCEACALLLLPGNRHSKSISPMLIVLIELCCYLSANFSSRLDFGNWTLVNWPTWSVLALLQCKHFLCLLWSVCCPFAFFASLKFACLLASPNHDASRSVLALSVVSVETLLSDLAGQRHPLGSASTRGLHMQLIKA